MSTHIMVDLETLGLEPAGVILSIGAVKFDPNSYGAPSSSFHIFVDPVDAQRVGMRIDASTVAWWLRQDEPARKSLTRGLKTAVDLPTALGVFSDWYNDAPGPIWGNGASFDLAILKTAYAAIGDKAPWGYRDERCFRTLKNLAPEVAPPENAGIAHDALDDARYQAQWAQKIILSLGIRI